jgi:hypothetical protein
MNTEDDRYLVESRHSMRCLLALAVQEAVKLALIDSVLCCEMDEVIERDGVDAWDERGDEVRAAWRRDIHAIPSRHIAQMDPMALAQNVSCRLLGYGGWMVGGLYAPNASPRDIFEASLERPDQNYVDEIAFDLGLAPTDDEDDAA